MLLIEMERFYVQERCVRLRQGRLLGRMENLGFHLQEEAVLQTLTQNVVESSSIEGELLDKEQVRSSLARRLGMDIGALVPADRTVEGTVDTYVTFNLNEHVGIQAEYMYTHMNGPDKAITATSDAA